MKRFALIFIVLIVQVSFNTIQLYSLASGKDLSDYILEFWKTDDGLPNLAVNVIIQSSDGFLWLGTQDGLARFDGVRFTVFNNFNTPEIKSNWIQSIYESSDKSIWIGTMGGGVTLYNNQVFTSPCQNDHLTNQIVTAIIEDNNHNILLGTDGGGICRLEKDGKITVFSEIHGLYSNRITDIKRMKDGRILITSKEGLNILDGDEISEYLSIKNLGCENIYSVVEDKNGFIWIGSDRGLKKIHGTNVNTYLKQQGIPSDVIYRVFIDSNNIIWMGTDSGLCRYDRVKFSSLTTEKGLTHNRIFSLCEDHEGSLWIGTHVGGLNRLKDDKFITISENDGLPPGNLWTVFEDSKENIWFGMDTGGLVRYSKNRIKQYTMKEGLSLNCVNALFEDSDGAIWAGTRGGGINILKDSEFTQYTTKDGLLSNTVRAIFKDSIGRIWIATDNGLNVRNGSSVISYSTDDGLVHNTVRAIMEDESGNLWFATAGGLSKFNDGQFTNYTVQDGLPDNKNTSLYIDSLGNFWVGNSKGLCRMVGDKFIYYSSRMGMFNDVACNIMEDDYKNLWISGHKGIYRVRIEDLDAFDRKEIDSVNILYLYALCNGGAQPAGWRSRDGRMWLPTVSGAVVIDPENIYLNLKPPNVVIENVLVDNNRIINYRDVEDSSYTLGPGVRRMEFYFTALSFLQTNRVKFKYQLEGFDSEWIDSGLRRNVSYTNLSPGNYRFHVIACNNDGVWNEEGSYIEFYIKPYFYQTAWFYILCIMLLGLLTFIVFRLRLNRLKKRQIELENLVEQRTQEIADANHMLDMKVRERTKELEEINKQLVFASRVKSQFLANISHELRTPLSSILGYTELLQREDMQFDGNQKSRFLRVINEQGEHLLEMVTSLLNVNEMESGTLKLHLTKENINNLIRRVKKQFSSQIQTPDDEIILDLQKGMPLISIDKDKISQVLRCIFENAIKFTPDKKKIVITTRLKKDKIAISIEDNGIGIPPHEKSSIFTAFYQVDASSTRVYGGAGLGLYLAKSFIELHHGTITVESELNKWTRFKLSLPIDLEVEKDRRKRESKNGKIEKATRNKRIRSKEIEKTILVVDDNLDVAELVRIMLHGNYRVYSAISGKEGIEKAEKVKPNLIFMDLAMPGMSGYETTKMIKKKKTTADIPIVALSARTMEEEVSQALQAGCVEHVAKPFGVEQINELAARYTSAIGK
ncbi:MAG: response regulator [Acidobacteria bacterium]|nr:response regulator [Acidobacteriota bacterium]